MFSWLQNSNNVAWETGQCGNTRSTFLPCNNYLERSSGCSSRKDLALQFNAAASCFVPTSLASVGIWVSNFFWKESDENITSVVRSSSVIQAVISRCSMPLWVSIKESLFSLQKIADILWGHLPRWSFLCLMELEKYQSSTDWWRKIFCALGYWYLFPWSLSV